MRYFFLSLWLFGAAPAFAEQAFDMAALENEELDTMRGGFLLAGGMTIDFAIIRASSVNGDIRNLSSFSSQDMDISQLNTDRFSTLINVGNLNLNSDAMAQLSGLVNVIQNSSDNAVIQNMNQLDIVVQNTQSLRNARTLAPLQDSHLLSRMR